jgi:uncharacterized protein (DUF2141 family)
MTIGTAIMLLAAAGTGLLTVDIGNVRNAKGLVHVDVCDESRFLKANCLYSADTPAHAGTVTLTVEGLPAGRYAIQAYHDENSNHDVDRGLFGIPKEGLGFSRDAKIVLGPPKWADALFDFDGKVARSALKLRYFSGPSGPPAR